MYGLFLVSLGYAKDLDLSELEIALEGEGQLEASRPSYQELFKKSWDDEKGSIAFALSRASTVMHRSSPATYPMADSWVEGREGQGGHLPGQARRALRRS